MKFIKKVPLFSFILFIAFTNNVFAYTEANSSKQLILKNLKISSNGSVVNSKSYSSAGHYFIDIKMNSYKLKKAYYTANILNDNQLNLSGYGMMSFNINNNSNGELRFNLVMQQADWTSLSVANDKTVLLKAEGTDIMEKKSPTYGTISIPKDFKGTVFIPFSSLGKQGLTKQDKQYEISKISSFGIISTLHENEAKEFSISDFNVLDKNNSMTKLGDLNFTINGDARVQLPVIGESIARYKVEMDNSALKDTKVTYKIHTKQKCISISDDGILRIAAGVPKGKITIDAVVGDSVYESKEIDLFKSWTLSAKEVDGTSKSIPKINAVKNLMGGPYQFIMSHNVMDIIRIAAILLVAALTGLYIYWKKRNTDSL